MTTEAPPRTRLPWAVLAIVLIADVMDLVYADIVAPVSIS